MTYHLTVGACSYCDYLGCIAGIEKAKATGVHVCEFDTAAEAIRALDKLAPTFQPGTVALRPGPCPEGQAARERLTDPHLAADALPAAKAPAHDDRRHPVLKRFEGQRVAITWQTPGGPSKPVARWISSEVFEGCLYTTTRASEHSRRIYRLTRQGDNSAVFAVRLVRS